MEVILAHGLGRSRMSMFLLGHRLSREGYVVEYFSYSALSESHGAIVSRLVARLRSFAESGKEIGLVGHSFGGLLFREALARVPQLRVRHLVLLGTPNQRPRLAANRYTRQPLQFVRRSVGRRLASREWFGSLSAVAVPYTIVAGTNGWRGRFSPFEFELNDGIVAVSETKLTDRDQPVLVSALHTFIMNNRTVFDLIVKKFGPT